MKILVVNKQFPEKTHYMHHFDIPIFMWGKRLSNYIFIFIKTNEIITLPHEISLMEEYLEDICLEKED